MKVLGVIADTIVDVIMFISMMFCLIGTAKALGNTINNRKSITGNYKAKSGFISSAVAVALGILFVALGYRSLFVIITLVCGVICFAASLIMQSRAVKKSEEYKDGRQSRKLDNIQMRGQINEAKAQNNVNKIMLHGGTKVVDAKIDTAVAQEQAKATSVKAASNAMRTGAIVHPKQAIEYAQASGALAEGKELADKYADKLMGNMAPTVVDNEYPNTTEEAKAVMSNADAEFLERIKSMSRDVLESIIREGAEQLMIKVEERTIEQVTSDVIKYTPEEYLKTVPKELDDEQKAAYMLEKMSASEKAP